MDLSIGLGEQIIKDLPGHVRTLSFSLSQMEF